MMLGFTGLGRDTHLDFLLVRRSDEIARNLAATVGARFEEAIAPVKGQLSDAGFLPHLANRRLQRFLTCLPDSFRKIPVMIRAQHQRHPIRTRTSRQNDATGQPLLTQTGVPLRTSTGAAFTAPRAAKNPLIQTTKMPAPTPASQISGLNSYGKSNSCTATTAARIEAPADASTPAAAPRAANSAMTPANTVRRRAPSARNMALSKRRSSMVDCTAANNTAIPAANVNKNTACTARLAFSMMPRTCCRIAPRSITEILGCLRMRSISMVCFSSAIRMLDMNVVGMPSSAPGDSTMKKLG